MRAWPPDRSGEAVAVLTDAFHAYPVMRYIIAEAGEAYDRRLHGLIGFFVAGRVLRGNPILAIEDGGRAVAVATLTPPGEQKGPAGFPERREALWRELGAAARARSEKLVEVWERLAVPGPQYHLNMLGVRRSHAGRGLGRLLLDAQELIAQHFGLVYQVAGANLEGMTHEQSLAQPSPGGNCANWILGHITNVQNGVMQLLGEKPVWESAQLERAGNDPITGPSRAIDWSTLGDRFLGSRERVWRRYPPFPTTSWPSPFRIRLAAPAAVPSC